VVAHVTADNEKLTGCAKVQRLSITAVCRILLGDRNIERSYQNEVYGANHVMLLATVRQQSHAMAMQWHIVLHVIVIRQLERIKQLLASNVARGVLLRRKTRCSVL
jgi:hypothetical protein